MPFVNCDGARIYWRVDGRPELPPLLLVGSLGSDHAVWNPVMAGLTRYFRVIRMDKRGHGASDAPAGDYSIERLGRDVLAVADAAGLARFSYAGLSIGGMIGMWLGANAGDRIERLVLTNTSAWMDPKGMADRIATVRAQGMQAIADAVIARWFTPTFAARGTEHQATARQTLLAIDPAGYTGCCAAIRDMSIEAQLPGISAPTLVISGTLDPSTPPEQGRRLAAAIPNARYLELPTAHFSHSEQPVRWIDWVVRFLQGDDAPSHAAGRHRSEKRRFDEGLARRKQVLGEGYVEDRLARADAFTAGFQDLITRYAWGEIWTRPTFDDRTRRLLVIAQTLAMGRWEEFRLHVSKGLDAGLEAAEIEELLLQSAIYCGVPAANTAFHQADELLRERNTGIA
jgi:3-oxoadipate enol-lactonase/4-carboxymuconolactone decarboxylase